MRQMDGPLNPWPMGACSAPEGCAAAPPPYYYLLCASLRWAVLHVPPRPLPRTQVCNPTLNARFNPSPNDPGRGQCVCNGDPAADCPPVDFSTLPALFISLKVGVGQRQLTSQAATDCVHDAPGWRAHIHGSTSSHCMHQDFRRLGTHRKGMPIAASCSCSCTGAWHPPCQLG